MRAAFVATVEFIKRLPQLFLFTSGEIEIGSKPDAAAQNEDIFQAVSQRRELRVLLKHLSKATNVFCVGPTVQ